jgi:2-polyprenyl-3-methyl-5-hydroxy-6-metoxy-1,4-benzoquinol methylase
MSQLIKACPNGCKQQLTPSGITVLGGELNRCGVCGQLVSSTTEARYQEANAHWNKPEGSWPDARSYKRLLRRRTRDIRNLTGLLDKKPSEVRLLDVGCSNGAFVHIANSFGMAAEGADTAAEAIADGKNRGLHLHLGYLQDIGFKNESFDVVTMYEVIEHVASSADLIRECVRILRPNGILLIGTGNPDSWTRMIRKGKWDFLNDHVGHVNFYSPHSLKIAAPQWGLKVAKVVTYSVKFFEKNELSIVPYRLMKLLGELLNLPARLLGKGHQMEVYLQRV